MAVTDVADESPPRWSRHDDHPPPRHDQSGSTPSDLVASLQRELDAALALDWDTVDGVIVADVAVATLNLAAKLDALRAKVATALDRSGIWAEQGHGSAAAMLRRRAPNRHRGEASRDVRAGERLRRMPHVAAAHQRGLITADHVRLLGQCLDRRFGGRFAEFEEQLVEYAIELPLDHFTRLVNRWKDAADESLPDDRDLKDQRAREVHLSRSFKNRGILSGTLTPIARNIVDRELQRLADSLFQQDWAEATGRLGEGNVTADDLARTPAQRRHDALVLMAERSATNTADACSPTAPVRLYVHCTEADLVSALHADAGVAPEPVPFTEAMCELDDGTPLSRATLVRLLVQGEVRRVVRGPGGEILEFGRRRRFFTPTQREAIAVRDRVCSCGCGLPAWLCEADHIIEWRDGGLTDLDNGQPACHLSHRAKTNGHGRGPGSVC
jgi:hypothetical protein